MIQSFLHSILTEYTYLEVYCITFSYFITLYFVLGPIFQLGCKILEKYGWVHPIVIGKSNKTKFEIIHSFKSIVIFGCSGIATIYLSRSGIIHVIPPNLTNTVFGLIILTLWNEVHFFIVHRIMHIPYFYRHIHKIHHQSKIPSVYAVYSFHWFEALLLSTVPITIAPLIDLSSAAIFLYPLASILLNYAGHCNYRFGKGLGKHWYLFGTRHAQHHYHNSKHYSFASNILDLIFSTNKRQP